MYRLTAQTQAIPNISHGSPPSISTQILDMNDLARPSSPPSSRKGSSRKRPASTDAHAQYVQERSRVLRDRLNTRKSQT